MMLLSRIGINRAGRLASVETFSLVIALTVASPACPAQDPQKVHFDTVDEVTLEGTYYPSDRKMKAPCVLLLHDLGGNCQQPGWTQLAKKLHANGFAVLQFDFRGHGSSTAVDPAFWRVSVNARLKNANPKKTQISYKDFPPGYLPMLVNDIAAARRFLDERNDSQECNTSNLILVGAQEGATLGALWLATEWKRKPSRENDTSAEPKPFGKDVAAAVWLSVSPFLGGQRGLGVRLDQWIRFKGDRIPTPIAFLFGEDDKPAAQLANHLYSNVLKADNPPRLKHTAVKGFKTKLAGVELIQKISGTDDKILNYLQNVLEGRGENAWYDRDTKRAKFDFVPLKSFGFASP
jgi:pimeloyl-ACP methyl ester carboxylesterase